MLLSFSRLWHHRGQEGLGNEQHEQEQNDDNRQDPPNLKRARLARGSTRRGSQGGIHAHPGDEAQALDVGVDPLLGVLARQYRHQTQACLPVSNSSPPCCAVTSLSSSHQGQWS